MGDHEWCRHNLETKDATERNATEIGGDKSRVVSSLLQQCTVYAMQDGGEIGSGPTARVQYAYCGTGEAEGLSKLCAEQLIYALHHVLHDLFRCVPDAELPAEFRIKRFEKRFVEVGYGFIFAEDLKESWLDAVQCFAGEIQYFLNLDGIDRARVGYFAE